MRNHPQILTQKKLMIARLTLPLWVTNTDLPLPWRRFVRSWLKWRPLRWRLRIASGHPFFGHTCASSRDFKHGRVLFAGDAAHVHSPVGGSGPEYGTAGCSKSCMETGAGNKWSSALLPCIGHLQCAERSPVAKLVSRNVGCTSCFLEASFRCSLQEHKH